MTMPTQVTCPQCGTTVPADNINVQKLVAVCPNCNTVFQFQPPGEQAMRRKAKQPSGMTVRETPLALHLKFHTNFRLDRDTTVMNSAVFMGLALMMALTLLPVDDGASRLLLSAIVAAMFTVSAYRLALRVYNHTHITMTADEIYVQREPLPALVERTQTVNLSGVVAMRTAETPASIEYAYDTPRYNVWAETVDGQRRPIITDLTEEYAYYVVQQLEERLHNDHDIDTSRLRDGLHDTTRQDIMGQTEQQTTNQTLS